jgi:hypothetical protein
MTCSRPLEIFNSVVAGLNKEFKSMYCTEDNMGKFFIRLTNRLGIYKPITGVEIYTTTVGHHVCARDDNKEPLVEFTVDPNATRHIGKVTVYSNNLMAFITKLMKEETTMEELRIEEVAEEYKPLIEVLPELKEGDVLHVPSNVMNITVVNTQLVWQDVSGELGSPVDFNLPRLKTPVRIQPKYVGWQEAFEAYENGYTIMCEYKGDMLELNRDLVTLQERSLLSDRELIGLLTTKWIIK